MLFYLILKKLKCVRFYFPNYFVGSPEPEQNRGIRIEVREEPGIASDERFRRSERARRNAITDDYVIYYKREI